MDEVFVPWGPNTQLNLVQDCGSGCFFDADSVNPPTDYVYPSSYETRTLVSLHPRPYTLHPTPRTLHPTPSTLHPTPYTLSRSNYPTHNTYPATYTTRALVALTP